MTVRREITRERVLREAYLKKTVVREAIPESVDLMI
jgi:hypothetical protein